jgi:hypothetical protein
MEGSGSTIEVLHPGYHGPPVMAKQPGHDQLLQQQDGWGTGHLVLGTTPPLLAKEGEGGYLSERDQVRE